MEADFSLLMRYGRIQFWKQFHKKACEIQTHLYTKVAMDPKGHTCIESFQKLHDHDQLKQISIKFNELMLLMAYASINGINVFMHLIEQWAKDTEEKEALEAIDEITNEVMDDKINKMYEQD